MTRKLLSILIFPCSLLILALLSVYYSGGKFDPELISFSPSTSTYPELIDGRITSLKRLQETDFIELSFDELSTDNIYLVGEKRTVKSLEVNNSVVHFRQVPVLRDLSKIEFNKTDVSSLKIYFSDTTKANLFEVFTLVDGGKSFLSIYNLVKFDRNPFTYLLYFLVFASLLIFPFYSLSAKITPDPISRVSLSSVFGFAGGLGVILLDLVFKTHFYSYLFLLLTLIFWVKGYIKLLADIRDLIVPISLFLLSGMVILSLYIYLDYSRDGIKSWDYLYDHRLVFEFPYKNYEQDYATVFSTSKAIAYSLKPGSQEYKEMFGVNLHTDRTPGVPLLSLLFFKYFGERFFVYQILNAVLLSLYVFPLILFGYATSKNRYLAYLAVLFVISSHFLLFYQKFTPTKAIVMQFIYLSAYLLLRYKERRVFLILGGLVFSVGYLTHQMMLVYCLPPLVLLFSKNIKKLATNLALFFIIPVLVFLAWSFYVRSSGGTSAIGSYSLAYDYQALVQSQIDGEPLKIEYSLETARKLLENKFLNLLGLFHFDPHPKIFRTFGYLRTTIYGAMGFCSLFLIIFAVLGQKKFMRELGLFVLAPIFMYIGVFLGFYNDLGLFLFLYPIVPVLYVLGLSNLTKLNFGKLLLILLPIALLAENFYINFTRMPYINMAESSAFASYSGFAYRLGLYGFLTWYVIMFISFYLLILKKPWLGKRQKQILIATPTYTGGSWVCLEDFVPFLLEKGYKISTVGLGHGREVSGVEIFQIPYFSFESMHPSLGRNIFFNALYQLPLQLAVLFRVLFSNFGVVISNGFTPLILSLPLLKLLGIPVFIYYGSYLDEWDKNKLVHLMFKALNPFVYHSFANSRGSKEGLSAFIFTEKISIVELWTDAVPPTAEIRNELREKMGFSKTDLVFAFVGRFVPEKGIELFVNSATLLKENPQIHFLTAGSGKLEDFVKNEGLKNPNFKHLGFIMERNEIFKILTVSDVVFGYGDETYLAKPSIEALAHGTPVIVSDIAAITEKYSQKVRIRQDLVPKNIGWIVPGDDPEHLARLLTYLAQERFRTDSLRKYCSYYAKLHHSSENIKRAVELIDLAVGKY